MSTKIRSSLGARRVSAVVLALLTVGGLLASTSALACRFKPDPRPWAEQVASVTGPVFVGRVVATDEGHAMFQVETPVRGATGRVGERLTVPSGSTSCHFRFSPGQRWFYAGATYLEPSRLLDDGPLPADVDALLKSAAPRGR